MGFGAIKDLKKDQTQSYQRKYIKNLIVGSNLASLLMRDHLSSQSAALFSHEEIVERDLFFFPGNDVRGEANIAVLKALRPELEWQEREAPSRFYKDQKFREFGGRSKSETLLEGEEFFCDKGYYSDLRKLLPQQEKLAEYLSNSEEHFIDYIEKANPERLDEVTHWKIFCKDEVVIECENLFWGKSPAELAKLIKNKELLSNELIEMMVNSMGRKMLSVSLSFEEEVIAQAGTYFLPQSMTHEWGHFIVEAYPFDSEQKCQKIVCFCYVLEEESGDEEVSKKIKLLKRVFERIFPDILKKNHREEIVFSEDISSFPYGDEVYESVENNIKNLYFLGAQAPLTKGFASEYSLEVETQNVSFSAREIASFHQVRRLLKVD